MLAAWAGERPLGDDEYALNAAAVNAADLIDGLKLKDGQRILSCCGQRRSPAWGQLFRDHLGANCGCDDVATNGETTR